MTWKQVLQQCHRNSCHVSSSSILLELYVLLQLEPLLLWQEKFIDLMHAQIHCHHMSILFKKEGTINMLERFLMKLSSVFPCSVSAILFVDCPI